jgi:HSP20 family protein
MAKDVVRLMHALFLPAVESRGQGAWRPAADVYQTRRGWIVKFDLAGVRPEDVTAEVRGRQLRVRGTRRDCSVEEGCHYYQMEIAYSRFERTLELPCDLERAEIDTEFRDGMLFVQIHCTESPGESCR